MGDGFEFFAASSKASSDNCDSSCWFIFLNSVYIFCDGKVVIFFLTAYSTNPHIGFAMPGRFAAFAKVGKNHPVNGKNGLPRNIVTHLAAHR